MSKKIERIEDDDDGLAFARATPVFLDEDGNGGDYEDRTLNATSKDSNNNLNPMEVEDGVVEGEIFKGEKQPDEFKDSWAAVLFLVQVVAVVGVAIVYAPYLFAEAKDAEANADTTTIEFNPPPWNFRAFPCILDVCKFTQYAQNQLRNCDQ